MISTLAAATIGYSMLLAALAVGCAAGGRRRPRPFAAGLLVVEIAVIALALIEASRTLGARSGPETATHWGYLAVAPLLIPAAAGAVRGDTGRWATCALAVGCLVVAVVVLRMQQTQGPTGA